MRRIRFTSLVVLLDLLVASSAVAQHPLAPSDTSNPRRTLESFLARTEEAGRRYVDYRDSPSRATQAALQNSAFKAMRLLDLSEIPPASRRDVGGEAWVLLWDVITRLEVPDPAEIPGPLRELESDEAGDLPTRWRIPGTEISIDRVEEGPRAGEFLFSRETVKRAREFFDAARDLPYRRPMPIDNVHQTQKLLTGWMIPMAWVEAIPDWANTPIYGQVLWKWASVLVLLALALGATLAVFRWSQRKRREASLRSYLRHLSTPVAIVALVAITRYLLEEQINLTGAAANVPLYLIGIAHGLAWVWIIWLGANWVATAIIASPRISARSVDAQLIRLAARCVGFLAATVLVFRVAATLGIPMYGLVAGAGVGGIAVALAAKNTLENFVGALHIFADRPVRVGDLCSVDEDDKGGWRPIGQVESIGLRSTKIRNFDRGLISIPNAELAQRNIVNLSACDRRLLTTTLALRYETTDDQLRFLLAELRELLHAHPRVVHTKRDPVRVRFAGFGDCSLGIEVRAYIKTTNHNEFLAIREDIYLRFMGIVKRAGTGFAFPSRTLYHTRDGGLDTELQHEAEKRIQEWVADGRLPFPDFTDDYLQEVTDSLSFPPEGSPGADHRKDEKPATAQPSRTRRDGDSKGP